MSGFHLRGPTLSIPPFPRSTRSHLMAGMLEGYPAKGPLLFYEFSCILPIISRHFFSDSGTETCRPRCALITAIQLSNLGEVMLQTSGGLHRVPTTLGGCVVRTVSPLTS